MDLVTVFLALLLPVGGIAGAWAAWRRQKRTDVQEATAVKWRDESLDEWRKARDAQAESVRATRSQQPDLAPGSTEEREETQRQQRIGG